MSELSDKILALKRVSTCLPTLALPLALPVQRQAAQTWTDNEFPYNPALGPLPRPPKKEKIRVGYFSADFHAHPVSDLVVGLFEHHDRSKFEVLAFSIGPAVQDGMRARVAKAVDKFVDVHAMSDMEAAQLSRQMEIDIAIDLGGHTKGCRTGIFAYKAAPVQINYLGFPGTMGAAYYDYIVADEVIIPPPSRSHYTEKVVYLPNSYLAGDPGREVSDRVFTRKELELPDEGFVFCCFNNLYKITPSVFDIWMRLLLGTEHSVLWLSAGNATATKNLREEASRRGVDGGRIIFSKRMDSPADHLARLRMADLFLDTQPYNAHATAVDALWAGLPILTCAGESFASRVAASLLGTMNMKELITQSPAEYESLAMDLAKSPARLELIKSKLAANRGSSALFDTALFAKHMEAAFAVMHERCHSDLPAAHFQVSVAQPNPGLD